jgi:hypothetical protein
MRLRAWCGGRSNRSSPAARPARTPTPQVGLQRRQAGAVSIRRAAALVRAAYVAAVGSDDDEAVARDLLEMVRITDEIYVAASRTMVIGYERELGAR